MALAREILNLIKKGKMNAIEISKELDVGYDDVLKIINDLKAVGIIDDDGDITPEFNEMDKYLAKR
jgi:hypothetical protein